MQVHRRHLLVTFAAFAAGAATITVPALAESPDEAAVAAAAERLRKAMIEVDRATLDALFADQLSYGHSDGRVQSKAEIIDALVEKRSVFHSIEITGQTIVMAGDVAVVRHRFAADAVSGGKPSQPRIAVLQVWQKQKDGWKLLVRQAHV
jgi:ketosteroid isomerase-like protein